MTKDEFGTELLSVVAYCANVQQLLRMIAAGVEKHKDVSHLSEQYRIEKDRAKQLVQSESISGEDAARLAREYPWLLA